MKRALLGTVVAVVLVVIGVQALGDRDRGYSVDAVFDTARGMVPGQLVKIAGARVGRVESVDLTADMKARMGLVLDAGHGPFRADATCRILPEGVVSENFIDCNPGTANAELVAGPSGRPTVVLERTEVAVTLQQVIDTFSLPTAERIRVLATEMGLTTSGRGGDLNAMIRRMNPALGETQRVLTSLRRQRHRIGTSIASTDELLVQVNRRDRDLRTLVASSAQVARTTAARAADVRRSLRELPPLLSEVDLAAQAFGRASDNLAPAARQLSLAAPSLASLNRDARQFVAAGRPAVAALGTTATIVRAAIPNLRPILQRLDAVARGSAGDLRGTRDFLVSLRDTGGVESLLNMVYALTALSSTFDDTSHTLAVSLFVATKCLVNPRDVSCSQKFNGPQNGRIPINGTAGEAPNTGRWPDENNPPQRPGQAQSRASGSSNSPATTSMVDALPETTRRDLMTTIDRLLR